MNRRTTLMRLKAIFFVLFITSAVSAQVSFTPESLSAFSGGESCIVDMDNDQLDDIVRVSGTTVNILFQTASGFSEQSFAPSPQQQNPPNWSIAAGDLDGDGYNDLFLGGTSRGTFLFNDSANGFSTDNQSDYIFCQRSTFADIDDDGDLDAFVCHDVDESHPYRNDGNRNIVMDQTLIETADLPGNYAAIWVDYDNDRDIDLYITKCKVNSSPGDVERTNLMYRNNGDGTYTEVAESLGINDNAQSWATVFDDLDNDGDMDMFIVNHDFSNRYYKNNLIENNNGIVTFTDIIGTTGIAADDLGSWENVVADFDNDGDLDILSELSKELYVNNGNNTFTGQDLSFNDGAIGDIDNDGDIDVVNGNTLYRNDNTTNDWIKIHTIGVESNSNGIGARIELTGTFGKQMREVRSGQGFRHMSSLTTHFGLGPSNTTRASVNAITIYWPSGTIDIINNPSINTTINVTEGQTLGLEDTLINNLIIYPNPTNNVINLNASANMLGAVYTIFDANGRRVMNAKLQSSQINVSKLSSGNYILRLISGEKIKTQKFIKR